MLRLSALLSAPLAAIICACALSAAPLFAAEDPTELSFGLISTESSSGLKAKWEPLIADLEKGLGMKVKAFTAADYAGIIEAMRFNKVDLAWMGNKSAIEAVDRSNGEVFAKCIFANGDPGYWSVLIVNKDSPYSTIDDVLKNAKDLSFANGDPNSTSGNVIPGYYIFAARKLDPKTTFKRVTNGSHEANAMAVISKQVDVATFNTEEMSKLQDKSPEKAAQLKAVWKSPLIPNDPMVYRTGLSDALRAKIKAWFLGYGKDEREKGILLALKYGSFQESSNAQLNTIRKIELVKKKLKTENDDKFSAEEKAKIVAELDAKIAALESTEIVPASAK